MSVHLTILSLYFLTIVSLILPLCLLILLIYLRVSPLSNHMPVSLTDLSLYHTILLLSTCLCTFPFCLRIWPFCLGILPFGLELCGQPQSCTGAVLGSRRMKESVEEKVKLTVDPMQMKTPEEKKEKRIKLTVDHVHKGSINTFLARSCPCEICCLARGLPWRNQGKSDIYA